MTLVLYLYWKYISITRRYILFAIILWTHFRSHMDNRTCQILGTYNHLTLVAWHLSCHITRRVLTSPRKTMNYTYFAFSKRAVAIYIRYADHNWQSSWLFSFIVLNHSKDSDGFSSSEKRKKVKRIVMGILYYAVAVSIGIKYK